MLEPVDEDEWTTDRVVRLLVEDRLELLDDPVFSALHAAENWDSEALEDAYDGIEWDPVRVVGLSAIAEHLAHVPGLPSADYSLLLDALQVCAADDGSGTWPVRLLTIKRGLAAFSRLRWELDLAEEAIVQAAVASGMSWGAIADLLNVKRQTVHKRWKPVIDGDVSLWTMGEFGRDKQRHILRRSDQAEGICGQRGGVHISATWDSSSIDCAQCVRLYEGLAFR